MSGLPSPKYQPTRHKEIKMILTQAEVNELTQRKFPASPARHIDRTISAIDAVLNEIDGQNK